MCMVKTPKMPAPTAVAAPEMQKDPPEAQKEARGDQRRRMAAVFGRRGTILTSPQGVTGEAPTAKKTLLGA